MDNIPMLKFMLACGLITKQQIVQNILTLFEDRIESGLGSDGVYTSGFALPSGEVLIGTGQTAAEARQNCKTLTISWLRTTMGA